jgi:hypothetical protein
VSTYRHPEPAVRKEMRRQRRHGGTLYGQDSRRRERARRDAKRAKNSRLRLGAWLIVLVAAAVFIIGWDHTRGPMDLPRPVEATDVTATPAPHPVVSPR